MINTKSLFISTFIIIITVYLYIFGQEKTIEMIKSEYLSIVALFVILLIYGFFKYKLKGKTLIEFNKNNLSLKNTILIFLIFQIIDYISEDGFIGMISLWLLYWVMGLIAFLLMEIINYYKNYKLIS